MTSCTLLYGWVVCHKPDITLALSMNSTDDKLMNDILHVYLGKHNLTFHANCLHLDEMPKPDCWGKYENYSIMLTEMSNLFSREK